MSMWKKGLSRFYWVVGTVGAVLLAMGCDSKQNQAAGTSDTRERPLIVCTTTFITDVAMQVAGDRAQIFGMMPAGVNPHFYKAQPDDEIWLGRADVVFYHGLGLETGVLDLLETAEVRTLPLAEHEGINPHGRWWGGDGPDPHVWWGPDAIRVFAEQVRDVLSEIDPDEASTYRANTAAFLQELRVLDEQVRTAVERIPETQRYLITSHDALRYYGETYGIGVDMVIGGLTEAETQQRVAELATIVVERRIPAVSATPGKPNEADQLLEAVRERAAETGYDVMVVEAKLYGDSLGPAGTGVGTYLGALRENTRIIVEALGGGNVDDILGPPAAGDGPS
jgi:manganese/zinc/iron transport system substrate-binding protein